MFNDFFPRSFSPLLLFPWLPQIRRHKKNSKSHWKIRERDSQRNEHNEKSISHFLNAFSGLKATKYSLNSSETHPLSHFPVIWKAFARKRGTPPTLVEIDLTETLTKRNEKSLFCCFCVSRSRWKITKYTWKNIHKLKQRSGREGRVRWNYPGFISTSLLRQKLIVFVAVHGIFLNPSSSGKKKEKSRYVGTLMSFAICC